MRQLGAAKNTVETWRLLEKEITDLLDMTALAIEENDQSLQGEIQQRIEEITSQLDALETRLLLSEEYDARNVV